MPTIAMQSLLTSAAAPLMSHSQRTLRHVPRKIRVHQCSSVVKCFLMKIRLFIKPYCPWCHKAMRWLDEHGIKYETLDVIADEAAFDEMIRLSGQELAPVIDVDGKVLADFGPEQLAGFWEKLERK